MSIHDSDLWLYYPDYATIARFCSKRLTDAMEDLFTQLVHILSELGELSLGSVFIDGTKLEADANRYSFVWRKSTQNHETTMKETMKDELPKLAAELGIRFYGREKIRVKDLKTLHKRHYVLKGNRKFISQKRSDVGTFIPMMKTHSGIVNQWQMQALKAKRTIPGARRTDRWLLSSLPTTTELRPGNTKATW